MTELRLYYDDKGDVICYTCEDLVGNYIVVDIETFAEGRPDAKVVDGKVFKPSRFNVKLVNSDTGIMCAVEDIGIIVDEDYMGETILWEEKVYESKRH